MAPFFISGFCSMKWLWVFLLCPGWNACALQGYPEYQFHLYSFIHLVERGTVRAKCPVQEYNNVPDKTQTWTTRSGGKRTTMRPPHLTIYIWKSLVKLFVRQNIIDPLTQSFLPKSNRSRSYLCCCRVIITCPLFSFTIKNIRDIVSWVKTIEVRQETILVFLKFLHISQWHEKTIMHETSYLTLFRGTCTITFVQELYSKDKHSKTTFLHLHDCTLPE